MSNWVFLRGLTRESAHWGDFPQRFAAALPGARVHLTPTEWRMLEFLARHPGSLVTRQTLLKEIWASEQVAD